MRIPFFVSTQQVSRLIAITHEWEGTPFSPHGALKGAGVDCVNYPALVYQELGFLPDYKFPPYTMDGGAHLAKSAVIEWVEASGKFDLVSGAPQPGDLLLFKVGRNVEHHCGLLIQSNVFTHCLFRRAVCVDAFTGWRRQFTRAYRPMMEEA
jgi:cell wall-associated NlpC family hydrolase